MLVHGAADGARLIALEVLGDDREAGARAIVAVGDHQPSVTEAMRAVAAAAGAPFAVASPDATELPPAALVAVAHLDGDGSVVDVARIGALAHAAGARVLLDASLTCGAVPIDLATLGVDAVVADAHRWLLGPDAAAMVWLGSVFGDDAADRLRSASAPFGRGTLVSLARSVGWLLMYAELPWVLARTTTLVERLLDGLEAIDGVKLATDRASHAALVAFRIEGWTAEQAADELSRSVFAILEADADGDRLRAGVGAWCRADELDRFVDRVRELAAHTPETLPRRPTLTVLVGPTGEGQ